MARHRNGQISLEQDARQHLHQLVQASLQAKDLPWQPLAHTSDWLLGESTKAPRQHNNQHQHTHVTLAPSLNTRTATDNDKAVASSTARGGEAADAEKHSNTTQQSTAAPWEGGPPALH
jgi:hypothetical protein